MKIKRVQMIIVGLITLTLSSCGAHTRPLKEADLKVADKAVTLEVLNPKVEISIEFEQMVKEYEKENPNINVEILTFGGGANYLDELKARFAANVGPDIFPNGGYEEAKAWSRYLEDLSDQPWVEQAYDEALEPMKMDGKIYGMPINFEGYGFIYNKDLFAKAGITPLPTTFTELKEAAKKLKAIGVTPFSVGYSDHWFFVLLLNIAIAQQEDPDAFIQGLNNGTQSFRANKEVKDVIRMLDLTVQYGNENFLTTDYNSEVELFATGRTAILKQGNWVQSKIDQISPNMNIGFLPMPINDSAENNALPVGVSNNWAVNKESSPEKKKEAKKFLNWMVSSETGKKFMKDRFHFISAFKNIETDRSGALVKDLMRYVDEQKTLSWNWFKFPPRAREEFGYLMRAYVGEQINRDQLLQELQKSWDTHVK
ncbi:ABC transporter substrate-binding protein [Paenibacillus odorifer]|uniref:ABC transporter substrate-binding protein n=1 Tax=Paenibacillus TaxID=44249 RepID=UPI0009700D51|nr:MULTISPECIES: ABC transporter substrate-binding protein [Paenibacillus]MDH6426312.1 raffinose/stachyose/melibiose transport system substrate-binding protein [Paenibacillus sp. PastH-4]MDH6442335.1 raffinose/stachyose/melibiose transport system substrate-binding protein [Paenibacillus sp. PastF-4]MDH6526952.1 raffinose/stachyose/melibiose transport system substrate-binding protein [Paenibacillus sp. PastH-3]OMD69560.1 ABC transporter substrate-binding protein [Paenibacillus odorifer]